MKSHPQIALWSVNPWFKKTFSWSISKLARDIHTLQCAHTQLQNLTSAGIIEFKQMWPGTLVRNTQILLSFIRTPSFWRLVPQHIWEQTHQWFLGQLGVKISACSFHHHLPCLAVSWKIPAQMMCVCNAAAKIGTKCKCKSPLIWVSAL